MAQTSQALDVPHRPGNVADSTGAREFIDETLARLRGALPGTRLEACADSAFFGDDLLDLFERRRVDYSVSVPFERFAALALAAMLAHNLARELQMAARAPRRQRQAFAALELRAAAHDAKRLPAPRRPLPPPAAKTRPFHHVRP